MKSIIIYKTKTGTTKKCAEIIHNNNPDSELYEISKVPSLKKHDNITFVTPIYMGQINKQIKKLMNSLENCLEKTNVQVVLVGTNEETLNQTIEQNFSSKEKDHLSITHVGGAYNFQKLNFLQRFIIKKFTGVTESTDLIKYDKLKSIII